MTFRTLAVLVAALAPLACSSSGGGEATTNDASDDAGGSGRDAASVRDAPAVPDGSDPPDAPDDLANDAPGPLACVSDAGPVSPGDFAGVPACVVGSCVLGGSLDGVPVSQTYPVGADFVFANGIGFQTDFGTGGHIDMSAPNPVASGAAETTVGTMRTPTEGPRPGSNLCLGDGSRLQFVADAGHLQIRFVAHCITGACGGSSAAPVDGELLGCCEN